MRLHIVEGQRDGVVHDLVLVVAYRIHNSHFDRGDVPNIMAAESCIRYWSEGLQPLIATPDDLRNYMSRYGADALNLTANEVFETNRHLLERWQSLETLQL